MRNHLIMATIRWKQVAVEQRVMASISAKRRNYEQQLAIDANRIGDFSRFSSDLSRIFQRLDKMLVGVVSSELPLDMRHRN